MCQSCAIVVANIVSKLPMSSLMVALGVGRVGGAFISIPIALALALIQSPSCHQYLHMGEISQGVQSMNLVSYFFVFLSTIFGNLEVCDVKTCNIF